MIKIPTIKSRLGTRLKMLILFSLFSLFYFNTRAQVTLSATGGTTSGTFTTLNAAFTAINAGTHQGVINIVITGNTTEPSTVVPLLKSASPSNYTSISIKPSGNVTVNGNATVTASRAMIELNGADNVTIDGDDPLTSGTQNLSFVRPTSTSTGLAVIRLASTSTTGADGADNNTIKNCIITGSRSAANSTTTNYGIVMSNSSSITTGAYSSLNTVIDNNLITRCYHGVYANGTSATYPNTGLQIKNNTIGSSTAASGVGNRGIFVQYSSASNGAGSALIEKNDIRVGDVSASGTGYSVTISAIEIGTVNSGCRVIRNNIHDIYQPSTSGYGSYGIAVTGSTNCDNIQISNNYIVNIVASKYTTSSLSSFVAYGIRISAGATLMKINHNTIYLPATSTGTLVNYVNYGIAATVSGVTISQFLNNIVVNQNTGSGTFGFYVNTTTNISGGSVNNNCYYVPNGNIGYYNAALRNTISDWKAASGKDGSSLSYNIPFISSTDFHINTTSAIPLESGGESASTTGITTDFDGDARPGPVGSINGGATGPDLGADEFDGIPADVVPPSITYTALTNTCSTTGRTLTATITDGGSGVPTSGGDLPILYYQINSGTLTPSQGVYLSGNNFEFALGSGVSATDTVKYFIVAQDVAGNLISFPSAGAGSFTTSPPAAGTPPTTPSAYVIGISLSGTYTVGSGGNYSTLTAAASSFNGNCLSGPVIFSLTDATYSTSETFPITFNSNGNSSLTNTLTILPATGVTSTITGSSASGLIILNGADYVTIDGSNNASSSRDLSINNSNTSAATSGILISSLGIGAGATNNTIKNINFTSASNTVLNYGISVGSTVGATGADNDNNTISGNLFTNFGNGIYAGGVLNGELDFLAISNNTHAYNGTLAGAMFFRSTFINNSTISSNNVDIVSSGTTPVGISLGANVTNTVVSKNLITRVNTTNTGGYGGRGITVGTGLVSSNIILENNVLYGMNGSNWSTFGNSSSMGISIGIEGNSSTLTTVTGGIKIYYNSVNLYGDHTRGGNNITAAIYIGSAASSIDIRNNVFANSINNINASGTGSKAYAIYSDLANSGYTNINYNNYYVSGTQGVLAYLAADVTTLSGLQTAFGQNVNSLNVNPDFNSNTNLRPNLGSSMLNTGTPIVGYSTDYLGATRNATNPTIGAYENGADGVGPVITYTALPTQCTVAGANLSVSVYDFSGVPTSGTDVPTLYWKTGLNGTYTSVQGTYTSGTNFDFSFGGGITTTDTVYYYLVAQDSVNNVSISPSAGAASLTASPPAAGTPPTTPNSYTIGTLLTGTIPVGAGGTYTTLTAAALAYNTGCISGAVVFSLTDVLYSSAETFPITFNSNGYASLTNYLTIKPAASTNTLIEGSVAAGSIFKLNGADFITIDGSNSGTNSRNLTIRNNTLTTAGNAVIWIAAPALGNGSKNNTLKNTIIEGNAATTSFFGMYVGGSGTITLTAAGSERNDNNLISNNLFRKSQYGLVMFGYDANKPDSNNRVTGNLFGTGVTGEGFNLEGVRTDRQKNMVIANNDIQNIRSTSTTALYGLRLLDFKEGLCYNNKIHNIAYTGSSTGQANGLLVLSSTYTTVGNPSNAYIFNNSVYDITSTSTSTTWALTGIIASTGYNDHYYYNSVSLTGQLNNSSSGLSAAFALGNGSNTTANTNPDIRNNVFSLTGTGNAGNTWAYYSRAASFVGVSNYNLLYNITTGGTANIGYLNSTSYTSLANWQTASLVDTNSVSALPMFNTNTNLVPQTGSPLVNAGTPLVGFTTDYLGNSRNLSTPTIGAYENAGDGTAPTITYTSLANTQSVSNYTFSATITDLGAGAVGVDTSLANRPTVYFKKLSESDVFGLANNSSTNGWKYAKSSSNASPFSMEIDYSLLNSSLNIGDTIVYFVVAQDLNGNLGAETESGFTGTNVTNVTSAPAVFGRYFIVGPPLSGTYSVGPGGNYTRLTDAVNDLDLRGLTSPVVFELTDTLYSTNETFPIVLSNRPNGISVTNTVTIQPSGASTDCRITGSNITSIFSIDNGDYYILDGRAGGVGTTPLMTILNTNSSAGVIRFVNDATNNLVRYCKLRGVSTSAAVGIVNFGTTLGSTGNDDNTITNNDIYDGATAPVTAIYSIGQDSTKSNHGNIISNNNIYNFGITGTSYGINMVGFNTYWTISGNSFYNQNAKTIAGTFYGIYLANSTGNGHTISGNYIGGTAPQCGGTALTFNSAATIFQFIYMDVDSGIASNVDNNTIKNINITTTSTSTVQALIFVNAGDVNVGSGSGNHLGDQSSSVSIVINTSSTSTTFAAIAVGTGTKMGNVEISNNDIGGITINQIAAAGGMSLRGIDIGAATRGLFTITNNIIGGNAPGSMAQNTANNALAFINRTTSNGRLHIVSGNIIRNFTTTLTSSGITGLSAGGTINSSVTNNTIYGLNSAQTTIGVGTSSSVTGILFGLQSAILENNCSGNLIYALNNTGAAKTTVTGIVVNTAATGTHNVFKNFVHSLNSSNDSSSFVGIHIAGGNANIYNNMVRLGIDSNGTDINTNRMIAGIFEAGGTSGVYFNTVYIGGAAVSTGLANTYGFYSTLTSGTRVIRNNIFTNKRMNSGSTGNHFAIYLATTGLNPTGLTLNNNNYFSSNSTIGYYNGSNRATFSNWRTAVGLDAASMNEDPSFINATGSVSNINLHITPATTSLMESGGVTISGISTDYDGDARPGPAGSINGGGTAVDIGADEFDGAVFPINMSATALVGPIGTCATTGKTVVVRIKNNSPTTTIDFSVNNVTVNADVTGPNATTFTPVVLSTDTLASGASMDVTISTTYDMSLMGTYTFNANTLVTGDANSSDDAMSAAIIEIDTLVTGTITSSVSQYCNTTGTPSFATTATGGNIQWLQSIAGPNGPWTNVGTNSTSYLVGSNLTQSIWVTATNTCNASTIWLDDTSAVHLPVLSSAVGDTVCGPGTVTLTANVGIQQTALWYASNTAVTPLFSGTTYSPTVSSTANYYVAAATQGSSSQNLPDGATWNQYQTTGGFQTTAITNAVMVFDALSDIKIASLDIYPSAAIGTSFTIEVRQTNGTGTLIASYTGVTTVQNTGTPSVAQTVPVNFSIPAGTNYVIGFASNPNTWRSGSTAHPYPYTLSGLLNITGSSASGTSAALTAIYQYYFYNWVIGTTCESPRQLVTALVQSAPTLTINSASSAICEGSSTTSPITISSTLSNFDTYNWSPSTGVSGNSVSGYTFNPTTTTSYTLTGVQTSGLACQNTANHSVTVNPRPDVMTISPSSAVVCPSTSQLLAVSSGGYVNTFDTTGSAAIENTLDAYPAPLSNYYGGTKHQMLITAAELNALGVPSNTPLNSIAFYVNSIGSTFSGSLLDFSIQMGNTASTSLSSLSFISAPTTVRASASLPISTTGWITIPLNGTFSWNGTSNLVIQTSYSNNNTGGTDDGITMLSSSTSFVSCNWYRADGVTSAAILSAATPTSSASTRPNMVLKATITPSFVWSSQTDLFRNSTGTNAYTGGDTIAVYTMPLSARTYTVTATTPAGCFRTASVSVSVGAVPSAPGTISTANTTTTGVDLSWTTVSGATSYKLDVATDALFASIVSGYNDLTVAGLSQSVTGLTAGTTYYARVRAINSCGASASSSSLTTITLSAAPVLSAASSVSGTGMTINWTATTGAASYLLDVSTSNTFNTFVSGYNGLAVPTGTSQAVTGLSAGTRYYYRVLAVNASGNSAYSSIGDTVTLSGSASLSLTAFFEGLYLGSSTMTSAPYNGDFTSPASIADTITVELHIANGTFDLAYSVTDTISVNGTASISLPGAAVGNYYYIVLKHRNSLETWSADSVLISSSLSYDFSTAATQAYGSNMVDLGSGVFGIYAGDINQDGFIDGNDFTDVDNDNSNFASGYLYTDTNGDGFVDGNDFTLIDNNGSMFIGIARP